MRRPARVKLSGRVGTDGRECSGVAGKGVRHHSAVADARRIDPILVDGDVAADFVDDSVDEADVVDALATGPTTAPAVGVPCPAHAVGIGDDELRAIRQLVPAVSPFGLLRAAEAAVHHDDQRCGRCQPGGDVEPIGPVQSTDVHRVQRRALDEAQLVGRTGR